MFSQLIQPTQIHDFIVKTTCKMCMFMPSLITCHSAYGLGQQESLDLSSLDGRGNKSELK